MVGIVASIPLSFYLDFVFVLLNSSSKFFKRWFSFLLSSRRCIFFPASNIFVLEMASNWPSFCPGYNKVYQAVDAVYLSDCRRAKVLKIEGNVAFGAKKYKQVDHKSNSCV